MITGKLRQDVDRLWEEFWTGGITNPLTVIEQISYLMFLRLLDQTDTRNEKKAARTGIQISQIYAANEQHLRWKGLTQKGSDETLRLVRDEVFPHLRRLG